MNNIDELTCGIGGTVLSAVGAGMSVTELQALISIIVTISGFVISVVIPLIIKIVKKVRAAKEDGVITEEEKKDIINTVIEGGKEVVEGGKEIAESLKKEESDKKSEGD